MKLIHIAIASLNRQKGKKIFLMIVMILGCAAVITLSIFVASQRHTIDKQFDEYGANIVILPRTENLSLTYGGLNVSNIVTNFKEIDAQSVNRIWEIPNKANIRAVSPKLLATANIRGNGEQNEVLVVGVNFVEELNIKSWWQFEGNKPASQNEVLIGSEVAEKMNFKVNDTFELRGKTIKISGIIKPTGSQDDQIIFSDFAFMAALFDKEGKVSLVEVSALCGDCPIDTIIKQISDVLPDARIKGIKQVMKQKMDTVKQFENFAMALTLIIVIMGGVLIFTSMMGAVTERTHEIGVYRAIGYKKAHIINIILYEAVIISTISGIIGIAAGLAASFGVLPAAAGFKITEVIITPSLFAGVMPAVIILGVIGTIYPAIKASKIDPVIALRSI